MRFPSMNRVGARVWKNRLLVELAENRPGAARNLESARPAITVALAGSPDRVAPALTEGERKERHKDREYSRPLKLELELFPRERTAAC
jgi:hypothetical protein